MNQDQNAEQTVTQSPAMVRPELRETLRHIAYPPLSEPPTGHARLWSSGESVALSYNGSDIVTISMLTDGTPKLRLNSDGDFQSSPFIQQFALSAPARCEVELLFKFPVECVNMRPRRARSGEAILGQVGRPLMPKVGGLYVPEWDLLLSVHNAEFTWMSDRVIETEEGFEARMRLSLGPRPLILLIRPRYYNEHLGYHTHEPWRFRFNPKPVAGWCSWEAYHYDVTQAHIENAAKALAPLRRYGLEYMQLDDGYQITPIPPKPDQVVADSWINTNEKFPGGHEAIVGAMKSGGFEPGIWTNAVVTNEQAAREGDYCIKDAEGNPVKGDWIQYILDCTPKTLAKHITPYYRAFRDFGYTYLKSDAIRHLIYDGLQEAVRLGLLTEREAFDKQRAYMESAREGIGPDAYYLSCWGVLTQSIGVCDAMRVATDANPNWYAFSMQMRETARWFSAQRILFALDPDHVCVRAQLPWVRMMLSLVSLSGGLYMISDEPKDYDEARLELIRRTLPPVQTRAAETGPIDYETPCCCGTWQSDDWDQTARDIAGLDSSDNVAPFSALWATHFDQGGRRWCVAQRAAVVPLASADISIDALSLSPDASYFAYDFWAQKPLGIVRGALHMDALALGETQVVALTPVQPGIPSLVGGDRHVSMDAVSVSNFTADEKDVRMELKGFDGLCCQYTLYGAAQMNACDGVDCAATMRHENGLTILRVAFHGDTATVHLSKS